MKILFLTDNFPPEVNAPATRTFEHCREWVKRGAEVTVITCAPNFPTGKVFPGYRNRFFQKEEMEGVQVIRVWSYITENQGFAKRILDYVSFAAMAFFAALPRRYDVLVATSPQFFTAVAGFGVSIFRRKPWIMEVRDLWPESIRAVGAMKNERIYRWLERLELKLYRHASRVVVVTDAFRENLVSRGIAAEKIEVVKNGVLLDNFSPREKDAALATSLGLEGKFVLAYIGTHGMAHGLDFILKSAKKLPPDVVLLFIGDGAEKDNLLKIKEKEGVENTIFLPMQTKNDIARFIALSDVALVNLRKSDTFKTVLPSKIFENAAMQKPILLGVEGEARLLVEQYGAGVCFEPEHETEFLQAIEKLKNPEIYAACQRGCTALASDFDRRVLADKMLETIVLVGQKLS